VYLDIKQANDFYAKYHESGHGSNAIFFSIGLKDKEDLIACMSFTVASKSEKIVENARLAFKVGCSVIGGFSRLLFHSLKELHHRGFKQLITYCDRDLTPEVMDSVYMRHGFKFLGDSGPSLFYWNERYHIIESRFKYQKYKLKTLFPGSYSDDKTEQEILAENKIYPCYNSGNYKFIMSL
jgi:hypothetical protein